jgi:hypothetical protein
MARFASLTMYILHPINIDQTLCYSDTAEGKEITARSVCCSLVTTSIASRTVIVCCKLPASNIVGDDMRIERTQPAGSATQLKFASSEFVAVLGPDAISMYIV